MGKHYPRVCSVCGKEETTGWSIHWKRKHPKHNKQELLLTIQPLSPWVITWFDFLSPEMQDKYKDFKPKSVQTTSVYINTTLSPNNEQKAIIDAQMTNVFNEVNRTFKSPKKLQELEAENQHLRQQLASLSHASTRSRSSDSKSLTDRTLSGACDAHEFAEKRGLVQNVTADNIFDKLLQDIQELKASLQSKEQELIQQKEVISDLSVYKTQFFIMDGKLTKHKEQLQKLKDLKLSCKLCSKIRQLDVSIKGCKNVGTQVDSHDFFIQSKLDLKEEKFHQEKVHSRCDKHIAGLEQQILESKDSYKEAITFLQQERDAEAKRTKEKFDYIINKQDMEIVTLKSQLADRENIWLEMFKSLYELSKQGSLQQLKDFILKQHEQSCQQSSHISPLNDYYANIAEECSALQQFDHENSHVTQQQLSNILLPESTPIIDESLCNKLLGKRQRSKSPNQRREEIAAKRLRGESLTLDEKRANESEAIKTILKKYESQMLHIKDWLVKSFSGRVSKEKFKKIGGVFCDGLLLPRLSKLFNDHKQYEIYLRSKGLQVQKISPSSIEGFIYVRLEDSANIFTSELIMKLNKLIVDLQELAGGIIKVTDIYIRQIDYTLDVCGFFFSSKVTTDLQQLSTLMNLPVANKNEYKSFTSCLYLLERDELMQKSLRDMWDSFWQQARSIFVFQQNMWTVVYAKNPVSTYSGQIVKINSQKDKIDFMKRFAIPGMWSIVIDDKNNVEYKVMKKGKPIQIPIHSLNITHQQKFQFDFDHQRYLYHLNDCNQIELVLNDGQQFQFEVLDLERKRDEKIKLKQPEPNLEPEVTMFAETVRTEKSNYIKLNLDGYNDCQFKSLDKAGRQYACGHCSVKIIRKGKGKGMLFLMK